MESVYAIERERFLSNLKKKAAKVKHLDSLEMFENPSVDVIKNQRCIHAIRSDINEGLGFLKASDELQNSYNCQLAKISAYYEDQIDALEQEKSQIQRALVESNCHRMQATIKAISQMKPIKNK
ncbi:MAG: hypothetical protein U0T73_02495 [Chitinophagales bacterium]